MLSYIGEAFSGSWGGRTSVVSVINYYGGGVEELFEELIMLVKKSKKELQEALANW